MTGELRWTPNHVDLGEETIYYEVTEPIDPIGTVVFGHGGAGCHAVWFQQVPVLGQKYRVITWDTRGFGCSTFRSGRLDSDIAAGDLAAVLDHAGVEEPVHLVAQSMGGWWLSAFASRWPERVRSLTYCNTPGGNFTAELEEHFQRLMADGLESSVSLGHHFALGPAIRTSDPSRAFLYQQINTLSPPPGAAVGRATAGRFDAATVRDSGIPVLVISGSDDQMFPPPLLRGVAASLGARFECIDGAGHSPYFEVPEAFNAILVDFLGQVANVPA